MSAELGAIRNVQGERLDVSYQPGAGTHMVTRAGNCRIINAGGLSRRYVAYVPSAAKSKTRSASRAGGAP